MFKFVVFCVLLWHGVSKISAQGRNRVARELLTDTPTPSFPSIDPRKINAGDERVELNANYNFHATQQTFYLNGPYGWKNLAGWNANKIDGEIRSDYIVTNGIGAHKLHYRKFSWNRARRACVEEGAHLAIIRTEAESKIIRQMMKEASLKNAWVGFHDKFEEGDWVTVLDEPIAVVASWTPWSTKFPGNPDNAHGNEHCATYLGEEGCINDDVCDKEYPFICKISIS